MAPSAERPMDRVLPRHTRQVDVPDADDAVVFGSTAMNPENSKPVLPSLAMFESWT